MRLRDFPSFALIHGDFGPSFPAFCVKTKKLGQKIKGAARDRQQGGQVHFTGAIFFMSKSREFTGICLSETHFQTSNTGADNTQHGLMSSMNCQTQPTNGKGLSFDQTAVKTRPKQSKVSLKCLNVQHYKQQSRLGQPLTAVPVSSQTCRDHGISRPALPCQAALQAPVHRPSSRCGKV